MLKKMMLIAVAAFATMAFAVPAIASAEHGAIYDTENEMTLTEGEEIHFTGTVGFLSESGSGFDNCAITGWLIQGAEPDEVEATLQVVSPGCEQGTGAFAGCSVVSASGGTSEGTVTGHDIDLYNVTITGTNNATCGAAIGVPGALEHVTLDFPEITLEPTPESGTSLDWLTVSGVGTATTAIGNLEITANGGITPTDQGTWAIETLPHL